MKRFQELESFEAGTDAEVGLDDKRIARHIPEWTAWKVKDVVLLKGDRLLIDYHESGSDRVGAVYSVTKSILSALIGIAIDRGELGTLHDSVSIYFPEHEDVIDLDPRKRDIQIRHLLAMTPGFDWPEFDKPYWAMKRTDDWVRYVWERPMGHVPGEVFTYNSGGSHLLSALLRRVTGRDVYDYAEEHLFRKLSFRKPRWNHAGGVHEGGAGLHLSVRDMAKFGQLYLRGGRWGDEQVLPADWVAQSTKMHHKGFSHYEPPIFGAYGYHWWISSKEHNGEVDCFFAKGYGGQYIFVVPEVDLVAAIRKEPTDKSEAIYSKRVLFEHLLPAIIDGRLAPV
ncbi:CubicO group peptidase (beta-lactamase class C family) [Paenibacillus phyllosphaerae]|uniref:CubicO group peptidase (Beta-lactamase class C family) n=1 Tax=Paenibacillus phyllosphaerae TaxID=274593 RepID=A0A7W5FQH6_9BACL|nr:serine hydrolase [Paenibacillus phyllosphaerae]MBB3113485.1 CubicO group peptidase (beta-lactamase class C family) [Paenibacillus phyllosphaerae]